MKVLIVSDSHRHDENLDKVIEKEQPIDMLIHCGDVEGSEMHISEKCQCPVYMVRGNNDYFSNLSKEMEFRIGRYQVFLTHGHNYYVSMGTEMIVDEAKSRGVDMVMFGHTHRPVIEMVDGIMVINPGSISFPSQDGKIPTYIVMEIDSNNDVTYKLCSFSKKYM